MCSKSISSPVVSTLLPCSLFYTAVFYGSVVNVHSITKKKNKKNPLLAGVSVFPPLEAYFLYFLFPPLMFSSHWDNFLCMCVPFFYACLFVRAYMHKLPIAGPKREASVFSYVALSLRGAEDSTEVRSHFGAFTLKALQWLLK